MRCALRGQLDAMSAALQRWIPDGAKWARPEGGYFLWLWLPLDVDAMQLHRRALANGVSVALGPIFSSQQTFGNYIWLNFGHPRSVRIEAAIETLGQLVWQARR
jgi:DNA-binding transcriptional MocR family regulator